MYVVFPVGGQVVVYDERHLLDVDASGQEVRGDEHARGAGAELAHDDVALLLVHVAMLKGMDSNMIIVFTILLEQEQPRSGKVLLSHSRDCQLCLIIRAKFFQKTLKNFLPPSKCALEQGPR